MRVNITFISRVVFSIAIALAGMFGATTVGWAITIDVVYVTHTPASMTQYDGFLAGIYGAGNVSSTTGSFTNAQNDAGQQATLEAADLIIIGRQTNSGDYDDAGEREYWNALDVPILLHSAYLVRSSRFWWLEGDRRGLNNASVDIDAPADPILDGVTPVGGEVVIYDGSQGGYDISSEDGTGIQGTIVATDPAAGDFDVVIARWDGTETLYSTGSLYGGPGNQRIFWGTPTSNDWISKLTADGNQMLTNAVTELWPIPEPSALLLASMGLLGLLGFARRRSFRR